MLIIRVHFCLFLLALSIITLVYTSHLLNIGYFLSHLTQSFQLLLVLVILIWYVQFFQILQERLI